MKKKFTLEIATPCSENFDKMVPNSKGSFCDSCAKNVIDLSRKTNSEIARFMVEHKNENICARVKTTQLESEFVYNEVSKMNNLKYAAIAASVLLTSSVTAQEKEPVVTEISVEPTHHLVGKIAVNQHVKKEISIIIKGKLLDAKTHRPLDERAYPDLTLTINNEPIPVKVNPKTGGFSIPVTLSKDDKVLIINISGSDYYLSKVIPFDAKSVKKNIFQQDIIIESETINKIYQLGGIRANFVDEKKE
ncbi:hypothetical protein [Flavobacterium pectinovorum]|uniref:Uncharacterized protein n=1 Tax=Flavobacterium pectinovorum TaxID=29533 RepID=A0A502F1E0_9FLAO|nr:hypothetical protein [Flavobacterium pectinovorum]TPG43988.1 hypothetical protein EAH81_05410 [Flavobacterium pectinovorum]